MPVPLSKLESLSQEITILNSSVPDITIRKRSTKAFFVAITNGKPVSPMFREHEKVIDFMTANPVSHYNIQKLHPVVDSELINKIKQKFD